MSNPPNIALAREFDLLARAVEETGFLTPSDDFPVVTLRLSRVRDGVGSRIHGLGCQHRYPAGTGAPDIMPPTWKTSTWVSWKPETETETPAEQPRYDAPFATAPSKINQYPLQADAAAIDSLDDAHRVAACFRALANAILDGLVIPTEAYPYATVRLILLRNICVYTGPDEIELVPDYFLVEATRYRDADENGDWNKSLNDMDLTSMIRHIVPVQSVQVQPVQPTSTT